MQASSLRHKAGWAIAVLGTALLGNGCRNAPAPVEQLVVARMAIEEAVDAGAMDQAMTELANARRKLQRARELAADKQPARARSLAEEAELDARVAAAKARRARAQRELAVAARGTSPAVPAGR